MERASPTNRPNHSRRGPRITQDSAVSFRWTTPIVVAFLCFVGNSARLPAQDTLPEVGRFEVSSIKAHDRSTRGTAGRASPDVFHRQDTTARALIQFAYGLQDFQIVGGPRWLSSTRFEVTGKASRASTRDQIRAMVRHLLQERFALVTHSELRRVQAYHLRLANRERRLGPALRQSTFDCTPFHTGQARTDESPVDADGRRICVLAFRSNGGVTTMLLKGVPISQVASYLQPLLRRPVVDGTGLEGQFDLDLTFADNSVPGLEPLSGTSASTDAPAIITAIREQLGLTLEDRPEFVEVVVIDAARIPSPN